MHHGALTGYDTDRGFLTGPASGYFTRSALERELFPRVAPDGTVWHAGFPADPLANEKDSWISPGRVTGWSPSALDFEGLGRPETGTEAFDDTYQATLAPTYSEAAMAPGQGR